MRGAPGPVRPSLASPACPAPIPRARPRLPLRAPPRLPLRSDTRKTPRASCSAGEVRAWPVNGWPRDRALGEVGDCCTNPPPFRAPGHRRPVRPERASGGVVGCCTNCLPFRAAGHRRPVRRGRASTREGWVPRNPREALPRPSWFAPPLAPSPAFGDAGDPRGVLYRRGRGKGGWLPLRSVTRGTPGACCFAGEAFGCRGRRGRGRRGAGRRGAGGGGRSYRTLTRSPVTR